ncbi:hypothetical protein GCM10025734_65410 [Kitasatospora paranensis]
MRRRLSVYDGLRATVLVFRHRIVRQELTLHQRAVGLITTAHRWRPAAIAGGRGGPAPNPRSEARPEDAAAYGDAARRAGAAGCARGALGSAGGVRRPEPRTAAPESSELEQVGGIDGTETYKQYFLRRGIPGHPRETPSNEFDR